MYNQIGFLKNNNIEYRLVDVTNTDKGYHKKKVDIEIFTKKYGWLETHSCSYFGDEQVKRFDIKGNIHTLSNTGVASPRILIPFLEKDNKTTIKKPADDFTDINVVPSGNPFTKFGMK
jgi:seryl-tRNA synthetase